MTQVTGILIDELGTVLANTTCAVVAIDQVVGQDGGGRVSRGSIVVTDGAGVFDADIKPGRYELVVEVSAPADANVKFRRIGRLSVLETGPMTLEEALDTHVTVTPGALLAAQAAAAEAADSAALSQSWAESPTPPDPDNATSKSAKTWAETAETVLTGIIWYITDDTTSVTVGVGIGVVVQDPGPGPYDTVTLEVA